jgi:hypothetical protein
MVIAIGTPTQVMQGLTTDPAEVLKAIESKLFLDSRASSMERDLQEFQRALDRTISALL